jgi:hypothetical protein
MRKLVPLLAATAALALPCPALAKGAPTRAKVCGPDACATVTDRDALAALLISVYRDDGSGTPAPGPFFRLTLALDEGGATMTAFWYVPSEHAVRAILRDPFGFDGTIWTALPSAARPAFDEALRGLEPFAPPTPSGVRIGARPVRDPASYLRLYTIPDAGNGLPGRPDWQPIVLRGLRRRGRTTRCDSNTPRSRTS